MHLEAGRPGPAALRGCRCHAPRPTPRGGAAAHAFPRTLHCEHGALGQPAHWTPQIVVGEKPALLGTAPQAPTSPQSCKTATGTGATWRGLVTCTPGGCAVSSASDLLVPPTSPRAHPAATAVWGQSRATGPCWTTNKGVALVLGDARGAVCRQRQETLAAGGPGTGQLGAQGQVAAVAELSYCLCAQGLGLEAQPGRAATGKAHLLEPLATCQENRTVPRCPVPSQEKPQAWPSET